MARRPEDLLFGVLYKSLEIKLKMLVYFIIIFFNKVNSKYDLNHAKDGIVDQKISFCEGYASHKKSNSEFWSAFFFNEFEIWFKSCKRMDRGPEYLISWCYASHKKSNLNSGLHFLFYYFLKWFRNMI